MAWCVGCEVLGAVRWRAALRDVLRVVLRAAASRVRGVGFADAVADRGGGQELTSLCRRRRSWCEAMGVRWLAARAAHGRSPFVSVLAGFASGLVALLLVRAGSR